MNLFKNDLLTSTMLSEPPQSRSYREPAFGRLVFGRPAFDQRYGRRRAAPAACAMGVATMELGAIEQIGDKCVLLDYDRAA
jgi:hypothetical protein